jgi:hypothetical protein
VFRGHHQISTFAKDGEHCTYTHKASSGVMRCLLCLFFCSFTHFSSASSLTFLLLFSFVVCPHHCFTGRVQLSSKSNDHTHAYMYMYKHNQASYHHSHTFALSLTHSLTHILSLSLSQKHTHNKSTKHNTTQHNIAQHYIPQHYTTHTTTQIQIHNRRETTYCRLSIEQLNVERMRSWSEMWKRRLRQRLLR